MRVLLVEDDPGIARFLAKGLREQSHAVDLASDGEAALYLALDNDYDLAIVDIMLPKRNGLDLCRELRGNGSTAPILMLTARDAVEDRIAGLDAGADDYLVKPFDFGELLARMRALARRNTQIRPERIVVEDLVVDVVAKEARRGDRVLQLTAKEYALLEYLARERERVVGRDEIAEHVWDTGYDPFSNLIEVYINRLRRKVDEGSATPLIHTRRGAGYILQVDPRNGRQP